jgi:sigma-B regulation protein RsbU (phosphoserine phosphatase)
MTYQMHSAVMEEPHARVLIADDQPDVLVALRLLLKNEGYQTEIVASPAAVLSAITHDHFDVALIDLNYARDTTSGQEGLDLITRMKGLDELLPIVVLTAWGTIDLAVEAMRRGGCDFVQKPWDNGRLLEVVRTQINSGRERRRLQQDALDQQRLRDRELAEAQEIQRGLLPKSLPQFDRFSLAAAWRPAREVSGDYFDVLAFPPSMAGLCIADVVGKGMPAALLMSNVQAMVNTFASSSVLPRQLCDKVNRAMYGHISSNRFITFFYALLDAEGGRLRFANAGHNPPLLIRADGSFRHLALGGMVIGIAQGSVYEQDEVQLVPGDRVVLFTDGVIEASNGQDEEFGEERLIELLIDHRERGAEDLQSLVMKEVSSFCGGNFQDDATIMVVAAN